MINKKITIGPKRLHQSWQWFGIDLVDELQKHFSEVTTFTKYSINSKKYKPDVVIHLKAPKYLKDSLNWCENVIFLPVDTFNTEYDFLKYKFEISRCKKVIVHSPTLHRLCHNVNSRNSIFEHHLKYYIKGLNPYKEKGFIFWCGNVSNASQLASYLKKMKTNNLDFKLLTHDPPRVKKIFKKYNNIEVNQWTEENHLNYSKTCKAALDIKIKTFKELSKPDTKMVNYLASGIPAAINNHCDSRRRIKSFYGFEPALPYDYDYWFSKEYHTAVTNLRRQIYSKCNLKHIGIKYKSVINSL